MGTTTAKKEKDVIVIPIKKEAVYKPSKVEPVTIKVKPVQSQSPRTKKAKDADTEYVMQRNNLSDENILFGSARGDKKRESKKRESKQKSKVQSRN